MWRYVYRAIDQHGQVIDVLLSANVTMTCCDSDGDYDYTIYGLIKTTQTTAARPLDPETAEVPCSRWTGVASGPRAS